MRRTTLLRYLATTLFSVSFAALAASSCSLITDSDIAENGIGMACKSDTDCQGASCDQGACVASCSADGDCPEPSKCFGGRCAIATAIGEGCQSNVDCGGARCDDGICVSACSQDTDCPAPTKCFSNTCQKPLKVAGAWVGVVSTGEGWSLTHHEGIQAAQKNLPFIDFMFREELIGDSMAAYIDEAAAAGADVIIANSFDHIPQVDEGAADYPDITFLVCSGAKKEPNIGSFFGNLEQAWFVAGRIAAQKTQTKRLGFIGSYITPEVVRHLNAYALGARSEDPNIKVEVRWLGFWYDPGFASPQYEYTPKHMGSNAKQLKLTAEEYLTAKLIDSGADVIGHQCDNQLPGRYVAQHTEAGTLLNTDDTPKVVYTIANDNRFGWRESDGTPVTNAIGAVYWNWEPIYTQVLSDIHRKKWSPSDIMQPLVEDTAVSTVGFELSTGEQEIKDIALRKLLNEAQSAGPDGVYRGPYSTTGQRATGNMPAGSTIDPSEYTTMCWLVENVVERSNPNDPESADQPAKVPDGNHVGKLADTKEPPEGTPRQPTTAPEVMFSFVPDAPQVMWNCRANQYPPLD